jgi:hypothetical protein
MLATILPASLPQSLPRKRKTRTPPLHVPARSGSAQLRPDLEQVRREGAKVFWIWAGAILVLFVLSLVVFAVRELTSAPSGPRAETAPRG